jgi:hypothetical protein
MSQGNPRATPPTRPVGALMRIEEAAKELGLEVVDLLEYALDPNSTKGLEFAETPKGQLRLCAKISEAALWGVMPRPGRSLRPVHLHDRRFAFVNFSNTPTFVDDLAAHGETTLQVGDTLEMFDGSGWLFGDGFDVTLKDLKVPRADVEALRASRGDELSDTAKTTLLKVIGALAKLLAKNESDEAYGSEDKPNSSAIARDAVDLAEGLAKSTIADKVNEGLAKAGGVKPRRATSVERTKPSPTKRSKGKTR